MSGKFKVARQYRTNALSDSESPITIEVHYSDGRDSRVYDNVHFPDKFTKKIFDLNETATRVIVRDSSNSTEETINRPSKSN
jgi:hypothetical protein